MDETARVDRETIIANALDEIGALLDRAVPSADVRALQVQAERLRRIVDQWTLTRPERAQVAAMHQVVAQLHDDALRCARPASGIQLNSRDRTTIPQTPAARRASGFRSV